MPCSTCKAQPHRLHRHPDGAFAAPCSSGEHQPHAVELSEYGWRCNCPHSMYVKWQDEGRCSHILEVKAYLAYVRPLSRTVAASPFELFDGDDQPDPPPAPFALFARGRAGLVLRRAPRAPALILGAA